MKVGELSYGGFGLKVRFEEDRRGPGRSDTFNIIIQKKTKHRCSPESGRGNGGSHKEVRSR